MAITEFQGEYRWLSNFWPAPVSMDGVVYPTVEHAYQAAKFTSAAVREQVRQCSTPGQAKRRARQLHAGGHQPCTDWSARKLVVMETLLRQKFQQAELWAKLVATEDQELVEGNRWHDVFWGKCLCTQHNGQGENHLGRLLMQVRVIQAEETASG